MNMVTHMVEDKISPTDATRTPPCKKVLVVEDESTIRETVSQILLSEGFEVITAADGSEALSQAQQASPDVIVLDIGLPSTDPGAGQFDGFGVMQWLGVRLPKFIPVIVLTARQDDATRRQAEALGSAAFLAKPFAPKDLLTAVQKAVAGRSE
jgi:two-component system alkaline phosphatase synthesis response regulator PhoP